MSIADAVKVIGHSCFVRLGITAPLDLLIDRFQQALSILDTLRWENDWL